MHDRTHHPGLEPERDESVATQERPRTRRPPQYRVVLHNDDFTTMEFVVEVLVQFFRKTATQATQIMLEVHLKGSGVAGVYTRDIAETRVSQVTTYAREHGFPLLLTVEPE